MDKQNELRETIIRGKTVLNKVRTAKLEWGRFGWVVDIFMYLRTRRLKACLKQGEALLEFLITIQQLEEHLAGIIAIAKAKQEQDRREAEFLADTIPDLPEDELH